ncbi:hypothetical protein HZ326_30327 [Fusarium oxysporum f. sp. albedinis]|nr:hypothetical protein HZ326_30327 [Fusarium oxysporum f. sp. albedinis]
MGVIDFVHRGCDAFTRDKQWTLATCNRYFESRNVVQVENSLKYTHPPVSKKNNSPHKVQFFDLVITRDFSETILDQHRQKTIFDRFQVERQCQSTTFLLASRNCHDSLNSMDGEA